MNTYIALLRGINVGSNRSLPMKELMAMLEDLGAEGVKTYIQSGNVVFRSGDTHTQALAARLTAEIKRLKGFEPHVLILGLEDWDAAMANNPFPEAEADPKTLHLGFLTAIPENPDLDAMTDLKKDNERFQLIGSVFYLHAPDGIGRSKLAERSERLLGVPTTDRNWRTVCKIRELAVS